MKLIGEVSSNHNKNLKRCFKFIDLCSELKFYAIKFQLFKIEKLFSRDVLKRSKKHRNRKKWELPISFIPKIFTYCKKKKIKFGCTPFYIEAVDILKPYVDFFKISSYELLREDLLIKCAQSKKTVIISTGMATYDEVKNAVKTLKKNKCKKIVVMHCISNYPAKIENCNLNSIKYLSKKLNCEIGWSDHSANPLLINEILIKYRIKFLEMHLDLDGKGYEYDFGHCWLPNEVKKLVDFFNNKKKIHGVFGKKFSLSERKERLWRTDPSDGLRPFKKIRSKNY